MRLIAAAAAAVIVLGIAATAASGSTGVPVLNGETNSSSHTTVFKGTQLAPGNPDKVGRPTVYVDAADPERSGLLVKGGLGTDGLQVTGRMDLFAAGIAEAKPGDKSATYTVPGGIYSDSLVIADLQVIRNDLWIVGTTSDPVAGTATAYFNRRVNRVTPVAIAVVGT